MPAYQVIKVNYPNFVDRDVFALGVKVLRDGSYLGRVVGMVSGLEYSLISARGEDEVDRFIQGLHLVLAEWVEAEVRAGRFRTEWSENVENLEFTSAEVLSRAADAEPSLPSISMTTPVEFTL